MLAPTLSSLSKTKPYAGPKGEEGTVGRVPDRTARRARHTTEDVNPP